MPRRARGRAPVSDSDSDFDPEMSSSESDEVIELDDLGEPSSARKELRAGMLKIHLERFGAACVPSAVTKTSDVLAIPTRVYVPWDGLPQIMMCRRINENPCEIFFPGEGVWKFYETGLLAQKALGIDETAVRFSVCWVYAKYFAVLFGEALNELSKGL